MAYKTRGSVDGIDAYERLAEAIIVQAVNDYRNARFAYKMDPCEEKAYVDMCEVRHFFQSGWFQGLTDLDGERILQRVDEEMDGQGRIIRKKRRIAKK